MDESKPQWLMNREWLKDRIALLKAGYIKSFWGAVAAFFLLQIFAFFLFQVFALYLENAPVFLNIPQCTGALSALLQYSAVLLYFAMILLVLGGFVDFQGRAFNNIRDFFSQSPGIPFPANGKEAIKLLLSVLFFIAFMYLIVYPPLPGAPFWQLALFYVFCWLVSILSKKRYLQPIHDRTWTLAFFSSGIFISAVTVPDFGNWSQAAVAHNPVNELIGLSCLPPPSPSNLVIFLWGLAMIAESLMSVLFSA